MGSRFANSRAVMFAIVALVFLITGIGVTIGTISYASVSDVSFFSGFLHSLLTPIDFVLLKSGTRWHVLPLCGAVRDCRLHVGPIRLLFPP